MRIVALNLQHGGGLRVERLADYLLAQRPDLIVASEFRPGKSGDAFVAALARGGIEYIHSAGKEQGANTVLCASRVPLKKQRSNTAPCDRDRLTLVDLGGLRIAGVYFRLNREKATLFDYLLSRPPELTDSFLVIGDMNTGCHLTDETAKTFHCADRFARLEDAGMIDLWRRMHGPDAREFTWYSTIGNGFRIDHAFGSEDVANRVVSCVYDHETRTTLTDHSALHLELADT